MKTFFGLLLPSDAPNTDNNNHNFHEELPCIGVQFEAIQTAFSDLPDGPYNSVLTYQNAQPNENILGYSLLSNWSEQSKQLTIESGITEFQFPNYPSNTGINIEFLQSISDMYATTTAFKVTDINCITLNEVDSLSQIVLEKPIPLAGTR